MQLPLRLPLMLSVVVSAVFAGTAALGGPEVTATRGYTIMPAGPRSGDNGAKYFNIQGKANGEYASYGLLAFPVPRPEPQAGEVEGLRLRLVESLPRFAKDGKVRFFLLEERPADPDALRFDADHAEGLGDRLKPRHALGIGEFKKIMTGHADEFDLTLDPAGRKHLASRVATGGEIIVLVTPDDDAVAATYFGSGAPDLENRPQLTIKYAKP